MMAKQDDDFINRTFAKAQKEREERAARKREQMDATDLEMERLQAEREELRRQKELERLRREVEKLRQDIEHLRTGDRPTLTARQAEIANYLADGIDRQQITVRLGVENIRTHLTELRKAWAMPAATEDELAARSRELGYGSVQ